MICFYLFWCLGYFAVLVWLLQKWPCPKPALHTGFSGKISLIIPFRNEAENIPRLASELGKLARHHLEILLVDDHSEDGSFELLGGLVTDIPNLRLVKSPGIGKKAALDFGIRLAGGALVLTSDADCTFPRGWAGGLAAPFSDSNVQLVAGPVMAKREDSGFFGAFQQIDWASIVVLTQFSFAKQKPLTCSGANLAFRKSAFLAVEGYSGNEHVLTGDDEFLLKKIREKYGSGACRYLPYADHLVWTNPQDAWSTLMGQRIRWASKWKSHRSVSHLLVAVFAGIAQAIWLGSLWVFLPERQGWAVVLLIWMVKTGAEWKALGSVLRSLDIKLGFPWFAGASLVHPFYVLGVGFWAIFGKFAWKGRAN